MFNCLSYNFNMDIRYSLKLTGLSGLKSSGMWDCYVRLVVPDELYVLCTVHCDTIM